MTAIANGTSLTPATATTLPGRDTSSPPSSPALQAQLGAVASTVEGEGDLWVLRAALAVARGLSANGGIDYGVLFSWTEGGSFPKPEFEPLMPDLASYLRFSQVPAPAQDMLDLTRALGFSLGTDLDGMGNRVGYQRTPGEWRMGTHVGHGGETPLVLDAVDTPSGAPRFVTNYATLGFEVIASAQG